MPFSETLLPEFEEEMKNTRKLLECVPDDKFDYQPHAKSMKLGRLATHVAEMPSWTVFTIDQDVLDMQPGHEPNQAKSRAELLEMFDKGVADARQRIQGTSDGHWQKTWTFKYAGKPIMSRLPLHHHAQRDHESSGASSRAVRRLPAPQRRGHPGNVRPLRRRAQHVWLANRSE